MQRIDLEMEERAKRRGFGVLQTYNFKTLLQEKGYPIRRNVKVYELCNPAGAQHALDRLPEISPYLPCRISVYEEDGKSVLATIGLESILGTVAAEDPIQEHFLNLFRNLQNLMESWKEE
jgi:uncharacterized protein (DUF302 family)